ncbi:unnamed protein product [Protopolystoma xenopodis]|uniref:Uncharacterized protein n=1 Tax=Protopolystoma xenopodis TaxID=117903 RepID=A0A448X9R0_9PLAT|nr:unnamed protein product [Protopolystoma xenopodis]
MDRTNFSKWINGTYEFFESYEFPSKYLAVGSGLEVRPEFHEGLRMSVGWEEDGCPGWSHFLLMCDPGSWIWKRRTWRMDSSVFATALLWTPAE